MNIAFLAHDKKKELMIQFCTAYKSVLMKHNLFATATTGRLIMDNTGLPITLLLSHKQGGHQQINARIAYNEIDLVLLFTDPNTTDPWDDAQILKRCHFSRLPGWWAAFYVFVVKEKNTSWKLLSPGPCPALWSCCLPSRSALRK